MRAAQYNHAAIIVQLTHHRVKKVIQLVQVSGVGKTRGVEYKGIEFVGHIGTAFNADGFNTVLAGGGNDGGSGFSGGREKDTGVGVFQVAHNVAQQGGVFTGTD